MDILTITTAFQLLKDVAKALPSNSPATQQIELLNERIKLWEQENRSLQKDRDDLTLKVNSLTEELADLQERFAASQLSTDEYEENGYVWRRTAEGALGPYCPNHPDVRVVKRGSSRMGLYCFKCNGSIRRA